MRKIPICILFIFFIIEGQSPAQDTGTKVSSELERLFVRLRSSTEDSVRRDINDSIKTIIESYAASDSVFTHRFSSIKYLGQIVSSDSLVKIITWNIIPGKDPGMYYCYFIKRSADAGQPNIVHSLSAAYDARRINQDTIYNMNNWYGALYYDLRPVIQENRQYWVLLGLNYSDQYMTRKVIDVLSFTDDNKIVFGRKWFNPGTRLRYRHVFEYASSGVMSLRFASDSLIVFDHLVPIASMDNSNRLYYGPDYSVDAYIFRHGIWEMTLNIDVRNKE